MNNRYEQMIWMADGDPVKLEKFERLPFLDYFVMLDKKSGT